MKRLSQHVRRRGFTLVELLVATAISVVLIGIVVGISGQVLSRSRQLTNSAIRDADAQFALEVLTADLEAVVEGARKNGQVLSVTPETVQNAESVWMLLLTHATDRDAGAFQNVARAVSYRLAYQNPIDGGTVNPSYALYRAIAGADESFQYATGVADLKTGFWDRTDPPAPPQPTAVAQFMAGNIVEFQVRFLRADTKQWTAKADVVKMTTGEVTVQSGPSATPAVVRGGLLAAEARITVLSPQGAKLLEIGALTLPEAIQRHGTTYSRQTARFPSLLRSSLLPSP